MPETAQPAVASAEAEVNQDLKFLGTIDGLQTPQLGAYLEQFGTNATQLQASLSELEQNLSASTP